MMSAGSHTEPGGYTGQGKQNLHPYNRAGAKSPLLESLAEGQFAISDERPPHVVASRLRELGLEPVWKRLGRRHPQCGLSVTPASAASTIS